jgi:MarR family transcriptional regulator, organic hydroperoxide resistance regulator
MLARSMSASDERQGVGCGDVGDDTARDAWRTMQSLLFDGETRNRMQSACAMTGVPPGVLKTLIHLSPDAAVPMREIAQHFGVDSSYVTTLVDDLEANGLAERRPHPTDRRVKTIALTPKGIEARHQIEELMYEPPTCFAALSETELTQLLRLLRKLAAADAAIAPAEAPHHHVPA